MKVTIEEMVETFTEAARSHYGWVSTGDGLRAVLEKHIGHLIQRAYRDGSACGEVYLQGTNDAEYARCIISSLTDPQDRRKTDGNGDT